MKPYKVIVFWGLAAFNLGTEIFVPRTGWEVLSKIVLMPALWWVFSDDSRIAGRLLLPLSLAWLGDICMLFNGNRETELLGLAAGALLFGLMQMIYFKYFFAFRKQVVSPPPVWPLVLFWILAQSIFWGLSRIYVDDLPFISLFILFYSGTHLALLFLAYWLLLGSAIKPKILIGTLLFVFTDLIIGFDTFITKLENKGDFLIMLFYISAQWLITRGLAEHWRSSSSQQASVSS